MSTTLAQATALATDPTIINEIKLNIEKKRQIVSLASQLTMLELEVDKTKTKHNTLLAEYNSFVDGLPNKFLTKLNE
jgi:hypothetical protein